MKKARDENGSVSIAREIVKSSTKVLSTYLNENYENMLEHAPKILFEESKDPYIKYDSAEGIITIGGSNIEEKFMKFVLNGIIAIHYYQKRQSLRLKADLELISNYSTDQLLKISFSSLFKRAELSSINDIKKMLFFIYKNMRTGLFEKFASDLYSEENADVIDLTGRLLAVMIMIANSGNTKESLKAIYYNGYRSIHQIRRMDPEIFEHSIETLFSNKAE